MRELRNLSRRDQELLSLKFEGELSYAEIARVLGLSDVNVRVSIFRALRRLRTLMEKAEA
jgi:RNA polymerase sigma factor (sigma-70 family)